MIRLRRFLQLYPASSPSGIRAAGRIALSVGLVGVFLWLLSVRLADIAWADVRAGFADVLWSQWIAASVFTGISFWAVGRYDTVLHRHFATGFPDALTRRAGICAIAVSQTTGLGVITGAVLRWRMLPGQSLGQAMRLTIAVAASFLAGWAVVTAAVLLALPDTPFKSAAFLVLVIAAGAGTLCILARPGFVRLPNGITLVQLLGLCAVDTIAAGVAFYVLCPADLDLTFGQILPVFLLALGAGLLSGTPGGVGAFELTLLALMPPILEPDLLAAVLAFRLMYYALPAMLGAGLAIRGPKFMPPAQAGLPIGGAVPPACPQAGPVHQDGHRILSLGKARWLCARTPHCVIGMFDPENPAENTAENINGLAELAVIAKAENRLPALYHASARTAVLARKTGLAALRIAQEAWICPASFDLAAPVRAGLRRKLRKGRAAGASVTAADPHGPIPWSQLDRIARDWATSHGGERGFSMGRYSRDHVRRQGLYIAWMNAQPVAFATFHQSADLWVLDLVRHSANPPDGVMHMLIHAAITDGARSGIARLSLAAVPDIVIGPCDGLLHRLIIRLAHKKTAGLAQFKSSFGPAWRPVYLVAPNPVALALTGAEIARHIFWPKPLPDLPIYQPEPGIEHHHADYEFASARTAWHRQAE